MSSRTALFAVLAVAASLAPKLAVFLSARAHAPSRPPLIRAHDFLTARGLPVSPIPGRDHRPAGWRYVIGGCQAELFPSGVRGSFDIEARSLAPRGDAVVYVHHGAIRRTRPVMRLALEIVAARLTEARRTGPGAEPGYFLAAYPPSCPQALALPWRRLDPGPSG